MSGFPLTVTTETKVGKRNFRFVFVVIGLLGVTAVYLVCFAFLPQEYIVFPFPFGFWERALFVFIGLWGLISVVSMPQSMVRGRWQLDEEEILFAPLRGGERALKWHKVEAVFWGWELIKFRAEGEVHFLVRCYASAEHRKEVRQFIRAKLTAFDLSDRKSTPWSLLKTVKLTLLAIPIALLALGAAVVHSIYLAPESTLDPPIGILWVLGPLFVFVIGWTIREVRRTWRLPQGEKEERR
jgi:TRAP-type C4-dicarboxylate transport system permease small subunit